MDDYCGQLEIMPTARPQETISSAPAICIALPVRLAILGAMFFGEKVLLSAFADLNSAQHMQGLAAALFELQFWSFRVLVTLITAMAVFAYARARRLDAAAIWPALPAIRCRWMIAHVLLMVVLAPLSYLLYHDGPIPLPFLAVALVWTVFAVTAVSSAFAAMAPWRAWGAAARSLGSLWLYAVPASLLGASAIELSQRLWDPISVLTFKLVRGVLVPFLPDLQADASSLILGTDRFTVHIAATCSGLEGMGLMLAFVGAWLLCFRRDYFFPRALLLLPIGLLLIFALNTARIAVLVLIGDAGFPAVAIYGFHSQAGWIAFNFAACGLGYASRRSAWFSPSGICPPAIAETENPTAAYVMPLLVVMIAGAVSRALASDFEYLNPLRLLAGAAAVAIYWKKIACIDWRLSWRGPVVGLVVFAVWVLGAHYLMAPVSEPAKLAAMSTFARIAWLVSRVASCVLIVPLAEELAYRGFLMRRLVKEDFEAVAYKSVGWTAFAVTTLAFALPHGVMWLPATLAGAAYGWVVTREGRLGEAVAAHAVTNALLSVAVLGWGQWQLW